MSNHEVTCLSNLRIASGFRSLSGSMMVAAVTAILITLASGSAETMVEHDRWWLPIAETSHPESAIFGSSGSEVSVIHVEVPSLGSMIPSWVGPTMSRIWRYGRAPATW